MDSDKEERCARQREADKQVIRELNDRLRQQRLGGFICLSPGIVALGYERFVELRKAIGAFDSFNDDNDPYGEHDFGEIAYGGEAIFWKIDYYDETQTYASLDPTDPKRTTRILTIMLAYEY